MIGLAVGAFALARVFLNIPAGLLTRRYGARIALILGAVFFACGNLMTALVFPYWAILASRFIAGIGSALFITAAVIFVAEVSTDANRGRLMALYWMAFLLGITLGPSAGGITAHFFGLRAPFILVALAASVAGIWAMTRIPGYVAKSSGQSADVVGPQPERQGGSIQTRSIFLSPNFLAISVVALAVFFTRSGALFNLFPLEGREHLNLDAGGVGLILTIPAGVNLMCQPFVGALSDRVGRRVLIIPGIFLFVASLLLTALHPGLALFAVALTLYGIGQAIEASSGNSYVVDIAAPAQRALALGVYRTCADVGLVVGSPLMGYLADRAGIPWAMVADAVVLLFAMAIFAVWSRPKMTLNSRV
jgi:DHA1 family multidrug resistance protein-like MFS transporter